MFVISIPATCSYDGADNIAIPIQFICSDRNWSNTGSILDKSYGTVTATGGGTTFEDCLYDIYTALGYNPFSINKTYIANNGSLSMDDLTVPIPYIISALNINYTYMPRNNSSSVFTNFKINGVAGDYVTGGGIGSVTGSGQMCGFYNPTGSVSVDILNSTNKQISGGILQFSEHLYDHGEFSNDDTFKRLSYQIDFKLHPTTYTPLVERVRISHISYSQYTKLTNITAVPDLVVDTERPNNPYIDPTGGSGSGGGDGSYADSDPTNNDPTAVPDVPNISAITTGLITTYTPTISQVQALGSFMWSSAFDIDTWKKLFTDPMQAIIGLGIIPITPTAAGTKSCKLGDVDTGVSMPYVSNQFVQKSCGSVAVKKEVGCFMDYSDTDISIYLPYCGMHQLNTVDVMGDTVSVTYNIDIVSGGCTAIISTAGKGVLYQFSGNCIANVPLTSINYSTAIQNAVSGALSIGGAALGAATGAAPLTAIGAAGLAKSAANIAMNKHGSVGRSGNMAGAAGLMGVQTPYLIITRPRRSVPKDLNKYTGYTYNVTMKLGQAVGFTMIDFIRLDSIPCTGSERDELYNLLQEGVIF